MFTDRLPIIISIGQTQINWPQLIDKMSKWSETSVTADLDKHNIPLGSIESFLLLLNHPDALSQINQSFLCCMYKSDFYEVIYNSNLNVLKTELKDDRVMFLINGTLKAWRESIIYHLTDQEKLYSQIFYMVIYNYFLRERLIPFMLNDYTEVYQEDKTFHLEHRNA